MSYNDPTAKSDGDILAIGDYNILRDNWLASVLATVSTKGDLSVATAVNAVARLAVGADDSILTPDSGEATGLAWQIQPACIVYSSVALDPDTESWTYDSGGEAALPFNSERVDTNDMHSTSTNTTRITVPTNGDGLYDVGASIRFNFGGITSGEIPCGVRILLNGTTVIAQDKRTLATHSGGDNMTIHVSRPYPLDAADYIECQVWTEVNVNVMAQGNYSPEFWAVWRRRQ